MTQKKNDTSTWMISLLLTIALGSLILWWIGRWLPSLVLGKNADTSLTPPPFQLAGNTPRISQGEAMLISADAPGEKLEGVEALRQKNYSLAIARFQTALQKHRNDPETWIYLNNAKAGDKSVWPIAVSVPIGSNLNVAQEILRGVAQAQDEINQAGGIAGRRLTVAIANDENDASIAKEVAKDLIASPVVAVVGHNASNASLAAAPLYQEAGLMMISPTSFANGLSTVGDKIFRTIPSIRFMADPLADYAMTTARKTNLVICSDSKAPDNLSFRDEFAGSFVTRGGKLVAIACDFADANFDPQKTLAQAISAGADGLLLAVHVDRIERAIALIRANQGRLALFASPTLYTMQTLKGGQVDANGMVLSVPWHPTASPAFVSQTQQYWGGTVNWRTATAYDATRAIAGGLQQLRGTEEQPLARPLLPQIVRRGDFQTTGATGKISFLPTGDRVTPPVLVQVQPGGSAGYSFELLK